MIKQAQADVENGKTGKRGRRGTVKEEKAIVDVAEKG